ncbi:hypothetical protein BZG36_02146 [Bifiguratus adelaidae]|uniref:Protein UXT n=1 Tax=Bifiguratus adelaidae TaxID=1938954 RepID=A0A261Y343_9FUNG|nr:hypothetical protein BZG36_02146 [Bifiguratus adelaidae]
MDKLARYESFVNEKLKVDLQQVLDRRDAIYDEISEYAKLRESMKTIQGQECITSMVDLGSNFYAQAKIPDTQYIYVSIGYGFHAQMTIPEANAFIDRKQEHLQKKADKLTQESAKIKAHIKIVLEAMSEILRLQSGEE